MDILIGTCLVVICFSLWRIERKLDKLNEK